MKKPLQLIYFLILVVLPAAFAYGHEPDSVYLFSYATVKNNNNNGLHFAWSRDRVNWYSIGEEYGYLRCDYGRWGSEKRMLTPYLEQAPDGMWHCIWSLNEREHLFAHAASADLISWGRQIYPSVSEGVNVVRPVMQYGKNGEYNISYTDAAGKYYTTATRDFKSYTPATAVTASSYKNEEEQVMLPTGSATGQVHRVAWKVVDKLIKAWELVQYKNSQNKETTQQDTQRFAGLKPVDATITIQGRQTKLISNLLLGIFLEDINYAADGGLYAELIQNRDFEYATGDKDGRDKNWNNTHSWSIKGESISFTIDTMNPVHGNNLHYAVLETKQPGASLVNTGFDGIAVRKGARYNFSLFSKGKGGKLLIKLVSKNGNVLAQATISTNAASWKNIAAVLTPNADASDAQLELQPLTVGSMCLDMISLFPENTFKGRKNGLRADLAQTIADIHPRFIRFPGGCVAHGDGLGNIYRWKNTIGPLETRKPQRNLWGYHQTAGLGYFEYFTYCEDIGAEPLPVLAAGVPCQNSGAGPNGGGQQGGIPISEMDEYIQDILDLVEYANGPVTSVWGKKRAEAGHPKPFNLKFIGIGNEDLISDVFEERFVMIYNVMKAKHPEITVIGTVGPASEGTDYEEGWKIAVREKVPMVDEHYYQSPGWFINNQEYYDSYDRNRSKVYLGEYAAHLPGRPNNLETALAEALYLTALERNGDVVSMASYAPLLAKEGHTQWNPDLIYFNNTTVKPTVGYEVQKLYGQNSGNEYLPGVIGLSNTQEAVRKRIAYSVVRDAVSGDMIIKLVNLLPVTVNITLQSNDITFAGKEAVKTVLTGEPGDKNARPVTAAYTLGDKPIVQLPAYSFTLMRLKAK